MAQVDSALDFFGAMYPYSFFSVPICAVISFGLVYVWISVLIPTEEIYWTQYKLGCYAIALSCIVEQLTQSAVLVAQSFCFVKLKVCVIPKCYKCLTNCLYILHCVKF